ncbi:hypothetical protein Srufu_004320 [Streptomyces libani subsp. rufus]|nr:hypothetical protein Srufu_004320 [Streptomyces libani subsp. rufus]
MAFVDVKVPPIGSDVGPIQLTEWFKQVGETVVAEEPLAELSTDKAVMDVPVPADGILSGVFVETGAYVAQQGLLARIHTGGSGG